MKQRLIAAALLIASVALSAAGLHAQSGPKVGEYDFEVNNVYYLFNDNSSDLSCQVCGFNATDSLQVTRVNSHIVYLGDTLRVTDIATKAWMKGASDANPIVADSLIIAQGVEVPKMALDYLRFRNVVLPDGPTTVQRHFLQENNPYIKSIYFPRSITSIEGYALSRAIGLQRIDLPAGVERIGERAFHNSPIRELVLPDSLISLGEFAFAASPLTKLVIGSKLTEVPEYCFYNSRLTEIPPSEQGLTLGQQSIRIVTPNLFIPENIVGFRPSTYSTNEDPFIRGSFDSITFGSGIKVLKRNYLNPPPAVVNLGGVEVVEGGISYLINSMKEVIVTPNVKILYSSAFTQPYEMVADGIIHGDPSYPPAAFTYRIEPGDSLLVIAGSGTMNGTIDVYLDRNTNTINNRSYIDIVHKPHASLLNMARTVTFGPNVTVLPNQGFTEATTLEKLTNGWPVNLQIIGDSCFLNLSEVETLTLPSPLRKIGARAFCNATSLKSVTLPATLESIGNGAFRRADALTTVTCYAPVPPECNLSVFSDSTYTFARLEVPDPEAYRNAPGWKNFRNIVTSGITDASADPLAPVIGATDGRITASGADRIEVFATDGRLVYAGAPGAIPILPTGIYIVRAGATTTKIHI